MTTQTQSLTAWLTQQLDADATWASHFAATTDDINLPSPPTDPAHVLRTVAAHRAIVELHTGTHECVGAGPGGWLGVGEDGDPCPTLRALASIYADRSGFDEAWR